MCGIAGFVGIGSEEQVRRMTQAIARRGPDDEGFYFSESVGFGFRRLSIIDVASGHQPLSNEDGSIWVMLNGEIYGYKTIMDELIAKGHRFKTRSDTEVIVHAYEEWGDSFMEKLHGMFAIALWDVPRKRLLLARDRMGKKPLYWTVKNQTLWFASELKALLAAGAVEREIDLVSLGLYFRTEAVPTPRGIFKNLQKLEPATAMIWSNGQIEKTWKFWEPHISGPSPIDGGKGGTTASRDGMRVLSELRNLIDLSVADRLVSDVPLGLFLSGGLDSAVVAESAARQGGRMKAFTIGFDDPSHDESGAAKQVAQAFGLEHYVDVLKPEAALGMIDEAVKLLDEPLADASILPQLLLSKFTRQQVTVALSGDGGDELFLGYQHIRAHQLINSLQSSVICRQLAKFDIRHSTFDLGKWLLGKVPAGSGYFSLGFKTQRLARGLDVTDPWARDVRWRGAMDGQILNSLLLPEVAQTVNVDYAEKQLAERAGELLQDNQDVKDNQDVFWRQWTWAYLRTFLMDDVLVKVDRASMWYALEARAPFLDTRIVEFLLNVPSRYKLGAWKNKRLFKELLRGKVPDSVLNKPKHGFAVPVSKWLNGPLADRFDALISESRLKEQGLFDFQATKRMADEHRAGRMDRRKEMWAMFMFQLWYDQWFRT
ncbi:MAG: asparagine synthase (glutamine-hydrolyzing) [Patescibacteria group bacterium]|jgi:asparagine synthase (glutamine-hydrolysing)